MLDKCISHKAHFALMIKINNIGNVLYNLILYVPVNNYILNVKKLQHILFWKRNMQSHRSINKPITANDK